MAERGGKGRREKEGKGSVSSTSFSYDLTTSYMI